MSFPNKTLDILSKAEAGNYGVPCVNCYNTDGVLGTIRAAEAKNSPAMIQVFPWSIHQFGSLFINFCVDACRNAKVPVALHLDHAMEEDIILRAIDMGFDSVMIDMSRLSPEENKIQTKKLAAIAHSKQVATEAELGRIDGAEDGVLPSAAKIQALITKPEEASSYVNDTGVTMLAPSFGNIHGDYHCDPREVIDFGALEKIRDALAGSVPIVLHGTNDFDEELVQRCVRLGVRKFNINKIAAQDYYEFLERSYGKVELTKVIEGSIDEFQKGVERVIDWLGSGGKA
ncbi:hypothetical protein TRVA0_009S02960 [Trichomonascus vanleenenianus]|uniref:class II fructose-bisphosphate aldolase n=1 Tax=Trichomonascus vanleenenianus TaxID=2268995 RepID=UPI003ECA674C